MLIINQEISYDEFYEKLTIIFKYYISMHTPTHTYYVKSIPYCEKCLKSFDMSVKSIFIKTQKSRLVMDDSLNEEC